ncbi:hypothetical protein FGF01_08015 [Aeromonas salmonicida subsp. achromogenes]|nr:hypothetical protein FGF02_20530 [Aeromonas salmonicida subsp. achromogenes]TMX11508.1 hypothetical protein FGF01_08015 [Aeromonas salmonicida subsp. achromogenes]TMX17507.1 hypothetical protein FGE99_02330 [Aeromonas salmonicida subsp. achromogenes]TMX20145.1 hypothetical protein FGF00_07820 [Aeromonas salmonicida subsp. achromogenes]
MALCYWSFTIPTSLQGGNWSDGNFGGSGLQPQFEPREVRRILVGEYEVRYEILDGVASENGK